MDANSDNLIAIQVVKKNGRTLLFQADENRFGLYYWNENIGNWSAIRIV